MTQDYEQDYGIEAFGRMASLPEAEIDLARAALFIAGAEYPDLDLAEQLALLDSLAAPHPAASAPTRNPSMP